MTNSQESPNSVKTANDLFYEKADKALRGLFEVAKTKNELHFALSLSPEFRGAQDAGWNTAADAHVAFREYLDFVNEDPPTSLKARVALAFYCHLSEASGFYEIPKNMLRVAEGDKYNAWPFKTLVDRHKTTGVIITPNANKVLRDLAGHAKSVGLDALAEVFRDAFDSDIRNGYAHADYIIWSDGIRLRKRNGGFPRIVTWQEFNALFERGINFFSMLSEIVQEYMDSYNPAKEIRGQLSNEPERTWTIYSDPKDGTFTISGGSFVIKPDKNHE